MIRLCRKDKKSLQIFTTICMSLILSPIMIIGIYFSFIKSTDFISAYSKIDYSIQNDVDAIETPPKISAYMSLDDSFMLSFGELTLNIPSSENEEIIVIEEEEEQALPYPDDLYDNDGVISAVKYQDIINGEHFFLPNFGQVRNLTEIPNETLFDLAETKHKLEIQKNVDEPQVLIMHTHESESYEMEIRDFYDKDFTCRTTDDEKNVAAVGDAIAKELENAGISVYHDVTKHDYPSYNGSYDRSRETVEKILAENPSIKIVLDIHRDAIERSDGTRIAPRTEIDGNPAAQVMIIACCDDGSGNIPNYRENFLLASNLQEEICSTYPTLARPILFDYRSYNQDLTTGSLLIEVGGHANSLDEAIYSGELVGKSLSEIL